MRPPLSQPIIPDSKDCALESTFKGGPSRSARNYGKSIPLSNVFFEIVVLKCIKFTQMPRRNVQVIKKNKSFFLLICLWAGLCAHSQEHAPHSKVISKPTLTRASDESRLASSFPSIIAFHQTPVDASKEAITVIETNSEAQSPAVGNRVPVWSINSGERISSAFSRWISDAGWNSLFWEASEFTAELSVDIEGDFMDAVEKILTSLRLQGHQIKAVFYGGNKVIRIVETSK